MESPFDASSAYLPELKEWLTGIGEKPYRAEQVFRWLHAEGAGSYQEMTNLPAALRDTLAAEAPLHPLAIETCRISQTDGTRKYLFRLHDRNLIESVLMEYHHGYTVCISSQAGCRMGCAFCASTLNGLARNLTAGEMLGQVRSIAKDAGVRVSNVVVMGSGEPLENYDQLVRFIRLISDEKGMNLSQRSITVSTCGIVPKIYALADEGLAVSLALSLHAPNDEKRRTLMPIANRYTIRGTLEAMRYYFEKTGRRLTFEYALIRGLNDTDRDAKELSELLSGLNCLVNLIPVNPVEERKFVPTSRADAVRFQKKLEKNAIHVTIRREMGRDIDGACGQLRKRYMG